MDANRHRQIMILRCVYRIDERDVEWITLENGVHVPVKDGVAVGGPIKGKRISGAISGALNPNSKAAMEHAERYYEAVRKRRGDVASISRNTGIPRKVISKIRRYVFVDEHDLDGGRKRFDPSYEMAESWRRLVEGKHILPHDITLLKHERMEMRLVEKGMPQREAHTIASKKYNYGRESEEYYAGLDRNKKNWRDN